MYICKIPNVGSYVFLLMTYWFQNGLLSALPYICQAVSGFSAGQIADFIRGKGLLSTTGTRRLMATIGKFSP